MKKYLIFLLLIFIFTGAVSAQDLNQSNQMGMHDVNEMHADDSNVLSGSSDKSFLNLEETISAAADESNEERNSDLLSGIDMGNLTVDCANQNPTGSIDESKLGINNDSSFSALVNAINQSDKELNLSHDYEFNESIDSLIVDYSGSIKINKDNLVINGNNKVIDGAGIGASLYFNNAKGRIIINDLKFINFSQTALKSFGVLTLNNVNFTGFNNPNKELIRVNNVTVSNCNFYSNKAKNIIYGEYAEVTINNSRFYGNDNYGSAVLVNRNLLSVCNSVFENFTYKNGAVIDFKGHRFEFINSKSINVHSDLSGGAVIAKYFPDSTPDSSPFLISDCVFANLSCGNDGGAVYIDLDSGSQFTRKVMNIVDSNFTDCHSKFGGALAILGGTVNINQSNFIDNSANFEGGAIYSSWTNLTISKSSFKSNVASKNAGAIYFDKGRLTINQSNFTANNVLNESSISANAIYAHDVAAHFSNSNFDNGGVAVYADFASDSIMENVEKNDDIFLMDNHNYIVYVENKGIKLNLTNNELIINDLPSRFDARDWGWTTPGRMQGDSFDCWAFATVAAIETAIGKSTGVLYNLSENYVANLQMKYHNTGDLRISATGFSYSGLGYALSWYGVLPKDAVYDDRGFINNAEMDIERIHVQDAAFIYTGVNDTIDQLKRAILKYGAVAIQCWVTEPREKIPTEGEDIAIADHGTHFVTIIGWDDSVGGTWSKGAWIAKDSGLGINEALLFTNLQEIDYYAIVPQRVAIAYIFENDIDYHVNYQTDLTGLVGFDENYTIYSNEFTSKYDELIGAVGTYFNESGINYSFDVFVNNQKVHTQTGISEYAGFKTIVLDKYLPIKTGDAFKVVFKSNSLPYQAWSRVHYLNGTSLASNDANSWVDFASLNKTVCLKVYTVVDDSKIIDNKDIAVDYDGGSYFSVKVVTDDGRAVGAGESVEFTINGKTTTEKTDDSGIAGVKISELPGKYTITTAYKGKTYNNTVTVKHVLKVTKVSLKNTDKKLILKATLKINGKAVAGKTVKFKFRGKTYTAKTNAQGIAKVTIKQNVIKNLVKNSYPVKVTYIKDTVQSTVKVKQVLKANKVTVKKSAKNFKLKASLKINGKVAKKKVIKFTFKGKTYKAKTNAKGIAQVTIKKGVINKFKKGKTYKAKVTYGKDYLITNVKLK